MAKRKIALTRESGLTYRVSVAPFEYRKLVYQVSSQYPPMVKVDDRAARFPGVTARDVLSETSLRAMTGKTGRGVKYAPRALLSKFQDDLAKGIVLLVAAPKDKLVLVNGKPEGGTQARTKTQNGTKTIVLY
jgi:hypothetical protein